MELGLIDQFGSTQSIARDIIGVEKLVNYTFKPSFLDKFAEKVGTSIVNTFMMKLLQMQ